jgi:hypothetical protein
MNAKYLITVWVCGQRDEGKSQGASIRRYPLSLSLSPVYDVVLTVSLY